MGERVHSAQNQKRKNALKCFENRRDRRPRLSASNGSEVEILAEFP